MIDTHAHIYSEEFDTDRDEVINRARTAGLSHIILANVDRSSYEPMLKTCSDYPDICIPTLGLHPTSIAEDWKTELDFIESKLDEHPFAAIGEIGLDLYWEKKFINEQQTAFKTQLQWAAERDLPVIIHVRDAFPELHSTLSEMKHLNLRGIVHSFSGDLEDVQKIKDAGNFLFGINGIVTFKKSTLPDIVKAIGIDHIVIETDSPYLSPMPHRGKRNEPANVIHIADKLSDIFECDIQEIDRITSRNAEKLFRIKI